MILLDTNYLIRALVPGSRESKRIIAWLRAGEALCTSAICWYEFLRGPVDEAGIDTVLAILDGRILPFSADQALEASRLFNGVGRKRGLRVYAMIAAAALLSNAALATDNTEDFAHFSSLGLRLEHTASP
jgi:predicted nucleic acid-binding protein